MKAYEDCVNSIFVEAVLRISYDFNIGVWDWPKKKGPDIFVVNPKS